MEVLCVVGCVAVAVGILGGSTWHVESSMKLRNTASEFLQTVKTARQYAIDHRCRTRVAFREGVFSDDPRVQAIDDARSYRLHAFVIPSSGSADKGRWVASGEQGSGLAAEWTRIGLLPRSESLVGRWLVCDLDPKGKQIPDVVKVRSETLNRFKEDPEQFFAENFFSPETTWNESGGDPLAAENTLSVYPADYRRTPIDLGPALLTGELPSDEMCFDPLSKRFVQAAAYWPGTVRFVRGMDPRATKDLPGIEFAPDGSLTCTWTPQIEFTFSYAQRPQTNFVVAIDAATGMARIAEEAMP